MHQSDDAIPIACNPQALGAEEWAAHQVTAERLFRHTVERVRELPDGYAFAFPAAAFPTVAAFVEGERRCCPFFAFALEAPAGAAPITLRITGSPQAKALLAEELVHSNQG
ncbi:MAG TPA: hypothetical protein VNL77_12195 [Roseiflexaceae bacterium]|nr:hypothetical protein [Roseiflexaceae bacterium]